MVFKRREKRSWLRVVGESFWPKGGWGRAAVYIKHRLHRLPDSPVRIARGIASGVFVSFTPFYGLHFITAFLVVRTIGGNVLAALLATFFGNPVTFPFIAAIALKTGYWILGLKADPAVVGHLEEGGPDAVSSTLMAKFSGAFADLWANFLAMFSDEVANWDRLAVFYHELFLPFLVGGVFPGFVAGLIAYYVSLPLITAYQNRRQKMLQRKLSELRSAGQVKVTGPGH